MPERLKQAKELAADLTLMETVNKISAFLGWVESDADIDTSAKSTVCSYYAKKRRGLFNLLLNRIKSL